MLMDWVAASFDFFFDALFAEAFAVQFLVGVVVFLIGLAFVALFIASRLFGFRTTGTVVGAVEVLRTKRKRVDGEAVTKTKQSLYPVYEYQGSDGATKRMRGSEGGTMTHSYTTGQRVNLIVREDATYDDVYDADKRGALYIGLVMVALGVGLMIWIGSAASAFGVSLISAMLILLLRIVAALATRDKKPARKKTLFSKDFDPADLKPVEHFART